MPDLRAQIATSADALKKITTAIAGHGTAIPQLCVEKWESCSLLSQVLESTDSLFDAREAALDCLKNLGAEALADPDDPEKVMYLGKSIKFELARQLVLVSYVTSCWSIYDRVANVSGRIAGAREFPDTSKGNPKVSDFTDSQKKIFGFATNEHSRELYKWPLSLSYKVRNWMVHEGVNEKGIELFKGSAKADGFRLHVDATTYLEKECNYDLKDGQIQGCRIDTAIDPWRNGKLLEILESYNEQNDIFFIGLVRWVTESLLLQVKYFIDPGAA